MQLAHLRELFPAGGFGFSMKMRPGDAKTFFAAGADSGSVLRERQQWLLEAPQAYAGATPESGAVVRRFGELAAGWGLPGKGGPADHALDQIIALGTRLEPDFLLLTPDDGGRSVLRAGCVCFPSSWALAEKLGRPVEEIHGVVPGLNPAVGERIHPFLARLKPGAGWLRSNWGLSSSPERNQHPSRALNQLPVGTPPTSVWLRVEHQILHGLGDGAVLFGIRLENVSLADLHTDRELRAGLHRSLATMPDDMAAYKNLTHIKDSLLAYLAS